MHFRPTSALLQASSGKRPSHFRLPSGDFMKRITFCAEDEDVRLLERFQQVFGGTSASAIIRMALRKMNAQPIDWEKAAIRERLLTETR